MKASFVSSYADPAKLPEKGLPQVAFLGRSNAGKSSLINSLTKSPELARTSAQPGRTKLINVFDVEGLFHLVDLPGYGFAKGSKKDRDALFYLIEDYLRTSALLRLAIVIVDSRLGPTKDDLELIQYLQELELPFFLIANKTDKLSRNELAKMLSTIKAGLANVQIFPHSAVDATGRGELYEAIVKFIKA